MPCGPCLELVCFHIVGGLGVVARRWCKVIHARVSSGEKVSGGGGGLMGYMLRFPYEIWCFWVHHFRVRVPDESSCFSVHNLLMWCDAYWAVTRFAHEMSCFSVPNEILSDSRRSCDFFSPMRFPYEISCFLVGYVSNETILVRFYVLRLHAYLLFMLLGCSEISICEFHICFLRLKRFHEIWLWDVMILRSLWEVLVRFFAVCCVILSWDFLTIFYAISCSVRFPAFKLHNLLMSLPYKISYLFWRYMIFLWDEMVFSCIIIIWVFMGFGLLRDLRMRSHGFWAFKRFDEIFLWDLMILGRFEIYLWGFLLFAAYNYSHEICWEGARVVGCAWSLSVSSLPATVFGSEFFRLFFLRRLWMNSASPLLTLRPVGHFSCEISSWYFHSWYFLMRFPREILLRDFMFLLREIPLWDFIFLLHYFLMRFHAYLQHSFLLRLPYEFSSYFMLSCRCEMSLWNLSRFAAYFSDAIILWNFMVFSMFRWDSILFGCRLFRFDGGI
jgi:hypothetical protein